MGELWREPTFCDRHHRPSSATLCMTIAGLRTCERPTFAGLGAGSKFSGSRPDEFGLTKMRSTEAHSGL
jgi:hypothetical protein